MHCATQLAMSHEPSENALKEDLIHTRKNLCCASLNYVKMMAQMWMHKQIGQRQLVGEASSLLTIRHHFFHAVEMNVRRHFSKTSAPTLSAGSKAALVESITTDEDLLFYWSISAEWEEKEEQILLWMVIDLWVTVRGFSFAKSMLEMYKQAQKKTVQKSKGVRKQLIGKDTGKGSNEVLSHDAD